MKAILCDICREEAESLFIKTGRNLDAAGDADSEGDFVDLCRKHAIEALGYAVTLEYYSVARETMDYIKKRIQSEKNERNRRTDR